MTGFDAELYLRRLGERSLLRGDEDESEPPLARAAQALVAVGAVDERVAEGVLLDYEAADAVRLGEYAERIGFRAVTGTTAPARPLRPRRVVSCDAELESGLHVRYVSLADDETTIGVRFAAPRRPMSARFFVGARGRGAHWAPPRPDLADDRGTTTRSHFSGGGGMDEWVGRLTAERPLAVDTAWLEVDGERVALTRPAVAAEVAIEPLAVADPALRHLWRAALRSYDEDNTAFGHALETLVAAGAIASGDPRLAPLHRAVGGGHGGRLPEPWRSLRSAGGDGRTATLALEAVTPDLEGISVAVLALESGEDHWSLEVEVAPETALEEAFGVPETRPQTLAWWAGDDRGQRYAGAVGSSGGGGGRASGYVDFSPALDPRATRVEIAAIAQHHQALIRFPLEWT